MKNFLSMMSLLAVVSFAVPAKADIIDVTVMGTVYRGTDTLGQFGPMGADLAGDVYTAKFKFDTSLGTPVNPPFQGQSGGSYNGTTSPSLGASLTINGNMFLIGGQFFGDIQNYNVGHYGETSVSVETYNNTSLEFSLSYYYSTFPATVNSSFTTDPSLSSGYRALFMENGNNSIALNEPTSYMQTDENLTSVPEPTSIALLAVGMIAATLTRRRTNARGDEGATAPTTPDTAAA